MLLSIPVSAELILAAKLSALMAGRPSRFVLRPNTGCADDLWLCVRVPSN